MRLQSNIRFVDERLKETFEQLETTDKELYDILVKAFNEIESNAFCGIQFPKRLIPKDYKKKYNIDNLWKYNLPNAWRLLYSIDREGVKIIGLVLDWMTHKEYEGLFNY